MPVRRPTPARRPLRRLVALVLAAVVLAGCNPQTSGTPADGATFLVAFPHVDNLVVGHSVRVADVVVGTVTAIELTPELTAEVTIVVEPDLVVPAGTLARIRKTSLLGEDFVALEFPGGDLAGVAALPAGATIPTGGRVASVEEVVERGIAVLGAIANDDLSSLVDSGLEIVSGREDQLRAIIRDVGAVTSTYADQTDRIAAVIDGVADLGAELEAGRDELVLAIDALADGAEVGASQRDRVVNAMAALDRVRRALEGGPLGDTRDEFRVMLDQLGGAADELAARDEELVAVLDDTLAFVERVTETVNDEGEIDLYIILTLTAGGQPLEQPAQMAALLEPPR